MGYTYPYIFRTDISNIDTSMPALYKIHLGSKYFIWKGKSLKKSVEQNMFDIEKLLRRSEQPSHLFYPAIIHIRRGRPARAEIEIVLLTEDPELLIAAERDTLADAREDKNCLNTIYEPHRPKWMDEGVAPREVPSVKKQPARNKPITDTFKVPSDRHTIPVINQGSVKPPKATEKVNSLVDAYKKLNGAK